MDAEENGTVVPTISTVDDDSAGVKLWKDMSLLKRVCDYQVGTKHAWVPDLFSLTLSATLGS